MGIVAEVVKDTSQNEIMFNIQVSPNLKVMNVPKSKIIQYVKQGFYIGVSNLEDLTDEVVDMRKINIFSKLYLMQQQEKLEKWLKSYEVFMRKMVRSESERQQLLTEYNSIIMDSDIKNISTDMYKKADVCATRLLSLHV